MLDDTLVAEDDLPPDGLSSLAIPDGIYLNLPNDAYHADRALGGSDLKAILTGAVQWHGRNRNPVWRTLNPPNEDESKAQQFGTAVHCMVLEPDEFDVRFHVQPERPALPRTKDEINFALAEMGRPTLKTSQKSVEFEAAARMYGIKLKSDWDDEQAILAGGRELISPKWDIALRMLRRVIDRHSQAAKFITNGRAEASVFWTDEHGTRLKCRFDYLRVRTVCDVKTYAQRDGMHPIEAFCMARDRFCYDLQAAHYMDARLNVLPRLVAEGRVFLPLYNTEPVDDPGTIVIQKAPEHDIDFFRQVAAYTEPSWWWLACSTMGVPEVDCVEFPTALMAFSEANSQVEQARRTYREFREKFGPSDDEFWIDDRGLIRLTDFNFGPRTRGRGVATWEADG